MYKPQEPIFLYKNIVLFYANIRHFKRFTMYMKDPRLQGFIWKLIYTLLLAGLVVLLRHYDYL